MPFIAIKDVTSFNCVPGDGTSSHDYVETTTFLSLCHKHFQLQQYARLCAVMLANSTWEMSDNAD